LSPPPPPLNICFRTFPQDHTLPSSHLFTPHMIYQRPGIDTMKKDWVVRT